LPFVMVDALIHCCKENADSDIHFYATKILFYTLVAMGSLLSLAVSLIPALIHAGFYALQYKISTTQQQVSGKEIYALLKKLETKMNSDLRTASRMITSIQEAYEENFHNTDSWDLFPSSFFKRDANSEELHQTLKDGQVSLLEKAEAIADYMKSKNRNAGKKLFNIILDTLESTADVTEDWVSYSHMDYSYDYSIGYLP